MKKIFLIAAMLVSASAWSAEDPRMAEHMAREAARTQCRADVAELRRRVVYLQEQHAHLESVSQRLSERKGRLESQQSIDRYNTDVRELRRFRAELKAEMAEHDKAATRYETNCLTPEGNEK